MAIGPFGALLTSKDNFGCGFHQHLLLESGPGYLRDAPSDYRLSIINYLLPLIPKAAILKIN
jgi:hypothetical protein